jgi:hypothetical protein
MTTPYLSSSNRGDTQHFNYFEQYGEHLSTTSHQRLGSSTTEGNNSTIPQLPTQSNMNQQFMYDPLLNTARQLGGQFAEQQRQKVSQPIKSINAVTNFSVRTIYFDL